RLALVQHQHGPTQSGEATHHLLPDRRRATEHQGPHLASFLRIERCVSSHQGARDDRPQVHTATTGRVTSWVSPAVSTTESAPRTSSGPPGQSSTRTSLRPPPPVLMTP